MYRSSRNLFPDLCKTVIFLIITACVCVCLCVFVCVCVCVCVCERERERERERENSELYNTRIQILGNCLLLQSVPATLYAKRERETHRETETAYVHLRMDRTLPNLPTSRK